MKPVDVGMVKDTTARTDLKVMYGTRNMTKGPAMTREEAVKGIEAGIAMAEELKAQAIAFLLPEKWALEIPQPAVQLLLYFWISLWKR